MKNVLLIFVAATVFVLPASAFAATGAPFGGLEVSEIPCTCNEAYTYAWFAPLYLGTAVPTSGALAAPVAPVTFLNYELHVKGWVLGFYTPGAQACQFDYVYFCAPIPPTLGVITPFAGVSP